MKWYYLHYARSLWTGPAIPCERCRAERVHLYYSFGPGVHHVLCALCLDELERLADIADVLPKVPS